MAKKKITKAEEIEIVKDELSEQMWQSASGKPMHWKDIIWYPGEDDDDDDCPADKITELASEYYLDLIGNFWYTMKTLCEHGFATEPENGLYMHFCARIIIDMEYVDRQHAAGKGSYMDLMNFVCANIIRLKADMDALYVFEEMPDDSWFADGDIADDARMAEVEAQMLGIKQVKN